MEVLTNTIPIDLHLKLRQTQEVVRIAAKHDDDPLRTDFNDWTNSDRVHGSKPTIFQLLMCRFKEMKGSVEFDKIEKEFSYTREFMGLIKEKGKIDVEEFKLTKEVQEENIRELLSKLQAEDVIIFTDGSALNNPGPTGAGGVVYMDGYNSTPVLLKMGVSPHSNNCTGELVGIQISLQFLAEVENLRGRNIHFFTDCQAAILTAFHSQLPMTKLEITVDIKQLISEIMEIDNMIHVHWVPGHKDIMGNELADQQAKAAAHEMLVSKEPCGIPVDKKEACTELKRQMGEKWKLKFMLSEKMDRIQETFLEVGKRICNGERDRRNFSAFNQLLCGHSKLNGHMSKINTNVSELCSTCNVPETVEHYLYDCENYKEDRKVLEQTTQGILSREDVLGGVIDLRVIAGNIANMSKEARMELSDALLQFIKCTKRFI